MRCESGLLASVRRPYREGARKAAGSSHHTMVDGSRQITKEASREAGSWRRRQRWLIAFSSFAARWRSPHFRPVEVTVRPLSACPSGGFEPMPRCHRSQNDGLTEEFRLRGWKRRCWWCSNFLKDFESGSSKPAGERVGAQSIKAATPAEDAAHPDPGRKASSDRTRCVRASSGRGNDLNGASSRRRARPRGGLLGDPTTRAT